MKKKEETPYTHRYKGWIVFFLLLWTTTVVAQQQRSTQKRPATTQKRPTVPSKPASPPKPPVDIRQQTEEQPWLQLDQPDSLQITLLEAPTTIPTKLDSLLKAHNNNKFARRIDSLLQIKDKRERFLANIQRIVRFDSIMTVRYARINTDKNYVIRPPERITFKLTLSSLGTSLASEGRLNDGTKTKTRMTADFRNSLNFSATYRSITIGGTLDPTRILRKNEDVEFNIVSYGNRFGGDAVFQRAYSFKGHADIGERRYHIRGGDVRQYMVGANLYYAFNYRKFSYAAAFNQTFLQKRSAGSFLIGASMLHRKTTSDMEADGKAVPMLLRVTNIGIGAGYGYNWVPHRRWLIHLSSLPTLMVVNKNKRRILDEESTIPFHLPQVIVTERTAIVYSFRNKFIGASGAFTYSTFGKRNDLNISSLRSQIQIFWGTRLWK